MPAGLLSVGHPPLIFSGAADYVSKKFGGFIHFGINTFTGNGYSAYDPTTSPNVFNPTSLNVGQWISTYKTAKMKYAILTIKHAMGFLPYPSSNTTFGIASSTWYAANGSPDIVAEFVNWCRALGIIPGFYISTADLNFEHNISGGTFTQAAYRAYNQAIIIELLTKYGPIGVFWFDTNNWGFGTPSYTGSAGYGTYGPWSSAGDMRAFVQSIQPTCLCIVDDHTHSYASQDVAEFEIFSVVTEGAYATSSDAIQSGNSQYAEEFLAIAAKNQGGVSGCGPCFHDANYTVISASSILTEISRVNACNGTLSLNAPPNQTGQIDSSITSVLATVGASLP